MMKNKLNFQNLLLQEVAEKLMLKNEQITCYFSIHHLLNNLSSLFSEHVDRLLFALLDHTIMLTLFLALMKESSICLILSTSNHLEEVVRSK